MAIGGAARALGDACEHVVRVINPTPGNTPCAVWQVHGARGALIMVMWLENTFPSWLMGLFVIGGGVLLTWVAVRIRHRRVKPGDAHTDNDLTEAFALVVTGMYGVLAAFMIFAVWTNYDNAQQAASTEGGLLAAIARQSIALPEPDRQKMLLTLSAYAESVKRDEWPTMAHGQSNPETVQLFNRIFVVANSLPAVSSSSDISTELADLSQARTALLLASGTSLPAVFWFILLLGAGSAAALAVVFFSETTGAHAFMAVAAGAVICAGLWLILELDYPLSSDLAFGPAAFDRALNTIGSIQAGLM
jgi:hypothetical protein